MRRRGRRIGAALLAILGVSALTGCRQRGRPDPNIRMAISHDQEAPAGPQGGDPTVPTRLTVPPEIAKAYSGIRVAWKDAQSGEAGILEVPLDGAATLPGSSVRVRADVFLPAFTMSQEEITSSGIEPENPAARITVSEGEKELFAGWIFARFPDVHPFQHPRFALRLEGGVRRADSS